MKKILQYSTVLGALISFNCNALTFGSGFFVSTNGHIITNAHVIKDAEKIVVEVVGRKSYEAAVINVDYSNDLALLKIEAVTPSLFFRSTGELEKGAKVYTIGYPNPDLQGTEAKYTDGVISSFSGLKGNNGVMQISVPIQPGNSGGPLLDSDGNVVGIIVSKLDALKVAANQDYLPENVSFAVKSDYAIPLLLFINLDKNARKNRNVSEVESATVLISSYTKAALRETIPKEFSKNPVDNPGGRFNSPSLPSLSNYELAKAYNCFACHGMYSRIVGPAFIDVAKKYAGDHSDPERLTVKVMKGGAGVWGSVPMPANPKISDSDARKLVKWILDTK